MNLQVLKKFLEDYGIVPAKTLGQNYLVDQGVLQKIVEAGELKKTDRVIEIGAGFGNLTEQLLEKSGEVIAFETDPRSINMLRKLQEQYKNFSLIPKDVTHYSQGALHALLLRPYKIISNIPYHITSWIFQNFLKKSCALAVFLLQKEVALRVCAKPGDMNLLALSVQLFGTPRLLFSVPSRAFYPIPKVHSAVLKVDMGLPDRDHPCPPRLRRRRVGRACWDDPCQEERVMKIARIGFARKRRKLLNNLSSGLKKEKKSLVKAFDEAGIALDMRSEELSLGQWKTLVDVL